LGQVDPRGRGCCRHRLYRPVDQAVGHRVGDGVDLMGLDRAGTAPLAATRPLMLRVPGRRVWRRFWLRPGRWCRSTEWRQTGGCRCRWRSGRGWRAYRSR
jgi:hypothetical protein